MTSGKKILLNTPSNHLGFTLVELIVVITILVILGTIGFVNLQGYSGSARDSSRVSDLTNIAKGLDMLYAKNNVILPPENGTNAGVVTIMASGTTIGFQGAIGQNILSVIKMSGEGKDPLDKKSYTYSTNLGYTKYQLLSLFEDSSTSVASVGGIIDTVYAGYETRTPGVKGGQLGILLSSDIGNFNQPVQENYSVGSFTGVDVATSTGNYLAYIDNKKTIYGTGSKLKSLYANFIDSSSISSIIPGVDDGSLAGYWNMETLVGGKIADLSGNGNHGTINNALMVSGKRGRAFNFIKGVPNTNILLSGVNSLQNVTDNDFTFAAWINPNKIPSGANNTSATIIGRPGWHTFLGYEDTRKAAFSIRNSSNTTFILRSNVLINLNEWHHVAGAVNSTNAAISIYVDGKLSGTGVFTGFLRDYGTLDYTIGISAPNCAGDWNYCFDGGIDEVRIYSRALYDTEVKTLYDATK